MKANFGYEWTDQNILVFGFDRVINPLKINDLSE